MDENFSMVDALSNLASVALVIGATMPPLLLLLLPVFLASLGVGRVYVRSARELKRLESTLKSPIYSNFAATIEGVATVRAFAGAGHCPHDESPQLVNPILVDFVKRTSGAAQK